MSKTSVFVGFDIDHDRGLFERFLAESRTPDSDFGVSGGSEPLSPTKDRRERMRERT